LTAREVAFGLLEAEAAKGAQPSHTLLMNRMGVGMAWAIGTVREWHLQRQGSFGRDRRKATGESMDAFWRRIGVRP